MSVKSITSFSLVVGSQLMWVLIVRCEACMCVCCHLWMQTWAENHFFPCPSLTSVLFSDRRGHSHNPPMHPRTTCGKKPQDRGHIHGNLPLYHCSYLTQMYTCAYNKKDIILTMFLSLFTELLFYIFVKIERRESLLGHCFIPLSPALSVLSLENLFSNRRLQNRD